MEKDANGQNPEQVWSFSESPSGSCPAAADEVSWRGFRLHSSSSACCAAAACSACSGRWSNRWAQTAGNEHRRRRNRSTRYCGFVNPVLIIKKMCEALSFPEKCHRGKESACNAGDASAIPGSGRSPGEGNGYPLQYSCLGNFINSGAWWATVDGVAKRYDWAHR